MIVTRRVTIVVSINQIDAESARKRKSIHVLGAKRQKKVGVVMKIVIQIKIRANMNVKKSAKKLTPKKK
jgi:hypothetical protein